MAVASSLKVQASRNTPPIYEAGQKQTAIPFTGTGFDIISRTGANQGLIRVSIYDKNGTHVKTAQVLNKSENGLELYQISVLSIQDLPHGTYTAKIFVAAAYDYDDDNDPTNGDKFNGTLDREGEFYFDAIRIYAPIDITAATTDAATAYEVYQRMTRSTWSTPYSPMVMLLQLI